MSTFVTICFIVFFVGLSRARSVIEQVDDTDLVHLLTGEDDVIVLFCKCSKHNKMIKGYYWKDNLASKKKINNIYIYKYCLAKSDCSLCDELESVLESIQNELKDNIGAVVVKAHNSHMVNLYDPTKEPALIYFRRGMPLLYHGEPDGEEILQVFSENREPVVKELSDENFEHLTQAATGATTGDWFVFL